MIKELLYLGLDVHAENIAVAIAQAGRDGEVRNYGEIPNNLNSVEKLLRKLGQPDKEQRLGSGDGERKTLLTRQIAFEPLPASVLFALVFSCGVVMGGRTSPCREGRAQSPERGQTLRDRRARRRGRESQGRRKC